VRTEVVPDCVPGMVARIDSQHCNTGLIRRRAHTAEYRLGATAGTVQQHQQRDRTVPEFLWDQQDRISRLIQLEIALSRARLRRGNSWTRPKSSIVRFDLLVFASASAAEYQRRQHRCG